MVEIENSGKDWTSLENEATVSEYFAMLNLQLAGRLFVKAHRIDALMKVVQRSRGAIEFKFMNISATLEVLGLPWLQGYKPARNFQDSLLTVVEQHLRNFCAQVEAIATEGPSDEENSKDRGFSESKPLFFEQPPNFKANNETKVGSVINRLIRQFDPSGRDAANRTLGKKGERKILETERSRLLIENPQLVEKIRWVSQEDGDGAGYDILSFDKDGRERFIEVKTTVGGQTTPFFISRNEIDFSKERPNEYRLVRLYDFAQTPRAFELAPPLENFVRFEAQSFRATFN
jgi:Domain of unknown function (DUF3883)